MRVRRKNNWDLVLTMSYEEVRSNGLLYVIRGEPFQVEYKTSVLIGISVRDLHVAIPILDAAAPALRIRRYFKATLRNDLGKVTVYYGNLSLVLHEMFRIANNSDPTISGSTNLRLSSFCGSLHLVMGKGNARSLLSKKEMWSNQVFEVECVSPLPLDGMRSAIQVFWEEYLRAYEILTHTLRALAAITGS